MTARLPGFPGKCIMLARCGAGAHLGLSIRPAGREVTSIWLSAGFRPAGRIAPAQIGRGCPQSGRGISDLGIPGCGRSGQACAADRME